ncbi:MotA/TolQ/ExbB proton channel family protein [Rhodoplanes sp. TEM]|uniref:MotA/TolQ/ExbB proton channel family protein n=1 Tax=Rhodoplanes tepidamans TaxID=200616 RepID=A0ABT5J4Y7_RHOTP|nr:MULTISPECIES: MotA/TolQ/ExbB proton channel family protein [Rhodoplanes]MDC7784697.1 MotA/TolQ/ExbB proton channel family protein [Rhodoplanes tepidamans]MDC7982164.1 MotA/TolQ/ExbB proton channel family protein [Rhodoplanes sp. TEM]MDQ0356168.1 hypothetical protein [Rhodoplanes tepidamans]
MSVFMQLSELLLTPVQLAIQLLFVLSLFESGRLIVQWALRLRGRRGFRTPPMQGFGALGGGYPLARRFAEDPSLTLDELDVAAMRQLELIRVATRVTPMLGLIATLIPMGPALVALTRNDVAQMSELLRSAFAAVVLALAAACLCFWIASVRRRWCAEELVAVKRRIEARP